MKKMVVAACLGIFATSAHSESGPPQLLPRPPFKTYANEEDLKVSGGGIVIVEDEETGCQTVIVVVAGGLLGGSIEAHWPRLTADGLPYCRNTAKSN